MAAHLVLVGDSIFDNGMYVPGGPSVLEHVRRALPHEARATLLAVDGAMVSSVFRQLERLPADATHLVLSVGGNNGLWTAGNVFHESVATVEAALSLLADAVAEFTREYRALVAELRSRNLPLTVCTIYDAIPRLKPAETTGLCLFNDVITRTAFAAGATLIDLRTLCREAGDYSTVSPIEPSAVGGGKIARAIVDAALGSTTSSRVVA